MSETKRPFLTLGDSTFAKIANGTVLVLLLLYAASKAGLIEFEAPTVTRGFDYEISAESLYVSSPVELQQKLVGFDINENELEIALTKAGVSLDQFLENVSMELVIDMNQGGFQGLVIEFQSTLDPSSLRGAYTNVALQIQNFVSSKQDKK